MDINPDKFATAKALGATDCVDSSKLDKPVQSHIVEMTKWGVDYTFDCTGVSKRFIFVVFRHACKTSLITPLRIQVLCVLPLSVAIEVGGLLA